MRVWLFLMLIGWSTFATGRAWGGEDTPPTITNLPATLIINRNSSSASLSFTIADDKTAEGSMIPVATSSNEAVIPVIKCELSGSGNERFLKITPTLNQTGSSNITVTIQDELNQPTSHAIAVTVNGPPTMENLPPTTTTNLNTKTTALMFTVGDVLTPVGSLTMSVVSSSNPTLIPPTLTNCVFAGSGANRTVTIEPAAGLSGSSIILLQVTDAGDSTGIKLYAQQSITVTVDAPPMISPLPGPLIINQYGSSSDIPFTVSDVLTLAANLTTTVTTSNATVIPADKCVITTTAGATNRSLKITPVSGQFADNIVIRVTVADGSTQTSYQEITVSVKEINRPPVITPAPTAHNYSLKVGGYTQILAEAINVTDPDGQPTLKTGSDYLRIIARIAVNRVDNQDSMELRTTEKCKLVRNGANYDIKWLTTNGTQLAEVTTANDGSLTITVKDGAQTVANSGTPAVGSATVLAELLKTINYTNQAGRFANVTLPTRTAEIQVIEGRPTNMPGGLTPTTLTSVITLLLDNEPPSNVAFATVVVSPGGQGRIVFAADQSGSIPRFDLQTENDALQISVNSPPNGGQVIDLVTNEVLTTNVPGSRLNPANAGGIGYRNGNPNFASDGFTLRVADAGNLGTIANVLVRIDSNATGDARFVSDPLLVMDRGTVKVHQVTVVGPTLTDVVLGVTKINGQVLSPSPLVWPSGVLKTDANGSAQTTLTINAPATGAYLEFMLTCTIGGTATKQPYLIRLTPIVPFAASN